MSNEKKEKKGLTEDQVNGLIFGGVVVGFAAIAIFLHQKNVTASMKIEADKVANQAAYFAKLTSEQVEALEKNKIDIRIKELNVREAEAASQKAVLKFKDSIKSEVLDAVKDDIDDKARSIFDRWSTKFEDRLDSKVDRITKRIDDLSDKYGGAKGNSAPAINVVNTTSN